MLEESGIDRDDGTSRDVIHDKCRVERKYGGGWRMQLGLYDIDETPVTLPSIISRADYACQ